MKKLGNGLSFLTKIMLVIGLLISNLSSLSMVFADQVTIDIKVVDDMLQIEYLEELADEVEKVKVEITESYTYLNGSNYYLDNDNEVKDIETEYDFSFVEDEEELLETETKLEDENVLEENNEETVTEVVNEEVVIEEETNSEETTNVDELEEDLVSEESDEITEQDLDDDEENLLNEENDNVVEKEIKFEHDSILSDVIFDGNYKSIVRIFDVTDASNEKLIDSREFNMEVLHEKGLKLTVVDDATGEELEVLENGRYAIDYNSPKVKVVGRLLAGGLNPTDKFSCGEIDSYCLAEELVNELFTKTEDFSGRLFGEYNIPVKVDLKKYTNLETNELEEVVFDSEQLKLDVLYGTYDLNAAVMNLSVEELGLDSSYVFESETKDGVVYVYLNSDINNTMLDLYNIVNSSLDVDSKIKFVLSNNEYDNVLSAYDNLGETVELNKFLEEIKLDETVMLSLFNDGLTVTYKVMFVGDNNNDNVLNKEDLLELIDQVIGEKEVNISKNDLDKNENVDVLDAIYLDQIIKNSDWNVELGTEEVLIDSELSVDSEEIVSGQEFSVNYIVKLDEYSVNGVAGLFEYDEEVLKLESVETIDNWYGNSKDGKFLYIGEDSLELPVLEENPEDTDSSIDVVAPVSEEDEEVITEDYVVVKATFTALKSGTHTIELNDIKLFNQDVYYVMETEEGVSVDVTVTASDNNDLSSLVVAGQTITLVDGQYEYEITVGNEITIIDVEAIVQNIAANVTSIDIPEELVEGENIVLVTVVSESGEEQVYTIKVNREKAPEVQYDYNYEYDDDGETDGGVTITQPEEDSDDSDDEDRNEDEEESNLSRVVIIILILLVIAGLIYLIFKDDDDKETKKVNKDINKLKKDDKEIVVEKVEKVNTKTTSNKSNSNSKNNNKNKNTNNKKKER